MRHKHADLIHAWAEGAEIEYKPVDVSIWKDCGDLEPSWGNDFFEYRIKPEKKPDIVRYTNIYANGTVGNDYRFIEEAKLKSANDAIGHIKYVICGETGKLIKAEVL